MLTYSFSKIGSESLYMYLYKGIREDILTGKITPGTKLPSKRSFAENLGVSQQAVAARLRKIRDKLKGIIASM